MSAKLRKKAKNGFEKDFYKLMNKVVFRKTIKNVTKHRDMKLVTTEGRRSYLVSEPNSYNKSSFRTFISNRNEEPHIS